MEYRLKGLLVILGLFFEQGGLFGCKGDVLFVDFYMENVMWQVLFCVVVLLVLDLDIGLVFYVIVIVILVVIVNMKVNEVCWLIIRLRYIVFKVIE